MPPRDPFYADLHIHSKYSRACSRDCDLEHLTWWARRKGISLVGTGDFTHPAWNEHLHDMLVPAEPGLYRLRDDVQREVDRTLPRSCDGDVRFMLSVEISTIYKRDDRTRKVHHLVYLPDLDAVEPVQPGAGQDRQPRFRRPPDPRPGLPRPAGDHAGGQPGRVPRAGAHLDPVVRRIGFQVGVRCHRGLLCRPGRPHLRGRDRPLQRSADELAGLLFGQVHAGQQLGRALAARARPGGALLRLRAGLLRDPGSAPHRRRVPRLAGVLPRGGQVPRGRASGLQGAAHAGRDQGRRRQLSGVRQAADRRRAEPDRGAGRPSGRRPPGRRGRLPEPGRAARAGRRDPRRRARRASALSAR